MHLLLLHGALGGREQLQPLAESLGDEHTLHLFEFPGHGSKAFPNELFSIPFFAGSVLTYMRDLGLDEVVIFGYSMGGYVGMYLAKYFPQSVKGVITLATKFHWDPAIAAKEAGMLDPARILEKASAFAVVLEARHRPKDWKEVLSRTRDMLLRLGEANTLQLTDYASITAPCLLLLGDRDKMVTTEETREVYKALPNGQMGILPGTPHPLEQVDVVLLSYMIKRFLHATSASGQL